MKRTTIAAGLLLLTTIMVQANIIEVDPNNNFYRGVRRLNPLTGAFSAKLWASMGNAGGAGDWVSSYKLGEDTAGFDTDFFANDPTDTASVSWHLSQIPIMPEWGSAAFLTRVRAIEVRGTNPDGTFSGDTRLFYVTPGHNRFDGEVTFTLPHNQPISQIYVWGSTRLPDSGTTLPLLGMALAGLAWFNRKHKQQTT